MRTLLTALRKNHSGATAIEYALVAALISLAIVIGVQQTGNKVGGSINNTANAL